MENSNLRGFEFFLLTLDLKTGTVFRHLKNLEIISRNCDLSEEKFIDYILALRARNRGGCHTNNLIASMNHYRAYKALSPINIPRFKKLPAPKAIFSDEEIEMFLSAKPPPKSPRWGMWTDFFSILAFTGARPGEIATLQIKHVDFGRGVFVLEDTKTRDNRLVPIPDNLLEMVKKRVAESDDYLFPGVGKPHIESGSWKVQFNNRARRIGIKRPHLTCHSLRHSLITRLIEEDVNLTKVGKLVGHKAIQTTASYTHLTTKDLHDTLRKDRLGRRSTDPKLILVALVERVVALFDRDDRFEKTIEQREDEVVIRVKIRGGSPGK